MIGTLPPRFGTVRCSAGRHRHLALGNLALRQQLAVYKVAQRLAVRTAIGSIARYERDPFLRTTGDFEHAPGNPWIPCTLWLAQYRIRAARSAADLRGAWTSLSGPSARPALPACCPNGSIPSGEPRYP